MAQSRTAQAKRSASRDAKRKRTDGDGGKSSGEHHIHSAIFAAPCCSQCGRQLPGVPFALHNIVCRDCYGMERYTAPAIPGSLPQKSSESTVTDEMAHADEAVIAE